MDKTDLDTQTANKSAYSSSNEEIVRDDFCTVYVGNLPRTASITRDILFELFSFAGPVIRVDLPLQDTNSNELESKDATSESIPIGYAFIEFASRSSVRYAYRVLDQTPLYGRPIRIRPASWPKPDNIHGEIRLQNLHPLVDEGVLEDILNTFGRVMGVKVQRPDGCKSNGLAYVSFEALDSCRTSIRVLNNFPLFGTPIQINLSQHTVNDQANIGRNYPARRVSDIRTPIKATMDTNTPIKETVKSNTPITETMNNTCSSSSSIHSSLTDTEASKIVQSAESIAIVQTILQDRFRLEVAVEIANQHALRLGYPEHFIPPRKQVAHALHEQMTKHLVDQIATVES